MIPIFEQESNVKHEVYYIVDVVPQTRHDTANTFLRSYFRCGYSRAVFTCCLNSGAMSKLEVHKVEPAAEYFVSKEDDWRRVIWPILPTPIPSSTLSKMRIIAALLVHDLYDEVGASTVSLIRMFNFSLYPSFQRFPE